jgi:hypothetical protein
MTGKKIKKMEAPFWEGERASHLRHKLPCPARRAAGRQQATICKQKRASDWDIEKPARLAACFMMTKEKNDFENLRFFCFFCKWPVWNRATMRNNLVAQSAPEKTRRFAFVTSPHAWSPFSDPEVKGWCAPTFDKLCKSCYCSTKNVEYLCPFLLLLFALSTINFMFYFLFEHERNRATIWNNFVTQSYPAKMHRLCAVSRSLVRLGSASRFPKLHTPQLWQLPVAGAPFRGPGLPSADVDLQSIAFGGWEGKGLETMTWQLNRENAPSTKYQTYSFVKFVNFSPP